MNSDIIELKKLFKQIKREGYIESNDKSWGAVGNTFEKLIGKKEENFAIPDYKTIEIKTMRENSTSKLHLFNATPDGDYLFPIKRVLNILGYPDKINKNYKVFNVDVDAVNFKSLGLYKRVKLSINREEKKVDLVAFDINGNDLEINTSWSFDLLEKCLKRKIKYLALIRAKTKNINKKEYFYYKKIDFYELKNVETFIDLLERGVIIITFKIGVYRSGKNKGKIHDRGTGFSIDIKNIEYLYKKIKKL